MLPVAIAQIVLPGSTRVANMIDDTTQRESLETHHVAFFSAQLVVDSDALTFFEEPWSPENIKHQNYYDNAIFGNTRYGDEERFRARGFGRVVGRRNYMEFSRWSKLDCVGEPDMLTELSVSYLSWVWLWIKRDGKTCADQALKDFDAGSVKFVGWPDRLKERNATFQRNLEHLRRDKCL